MDKTGSLAMLPGSRSLPRSITEEHCDKLCVTLRGASAAIRNTKVFGERNSEGQKMFLLACSIGHVECMQLLVDAGCNTTVTDNNGANALIHAALSGVAAAVSTALAAGWCELEARDENGATAFLAACYSGSIECMQLLVDAGCNTTVTRNCGSNALMHAARSGVAAAVSTALAAGWCELEARDEDGDTAFLVACYSGSIECMQLLVDAGCETAAINKHSETAFDVAKACDNVEALHWLHELDKKSRVAALWHQAREMLASSRLPEALTAAEQAIRLRPGSTELARLRDEIQSAVKNEFEVRDRQSRIAEAELMAMLDGESAPVECSVEQAQKAQRKREKRRRQQQAKREAAARRAQAMAQAETEAPGSQVSEPEMSHQPAPLSPAVQSPMRPLVDSESDEASTPVRTPPDEFCCPITSECMRDPVIVTATGMTYEREAIAEWFKKHDTDPSTGVELDENKQLVPNVITRKMIDAWSSGCLRILNPSQ